MRPSQGARVLEIGCGTGAVTRVLAAWPGVAEAVGVDPSPVFVAKARELGAGFATLVFADALATSGQLGADLAAALKAEARRRVTSGEYFGHIAYMSSVARKPG